VRPIAPSQFYSFAVDFPRATMPAHFYIALLLYRNRATPSPPFVYVMLLLFVVHKRLAVPFPSPRFARPSPVKDRYFLDSYPPYGITAPSRPLVRPFVRVGLKRRALCHSFPLAIPVRSATLFFPTSSSIVVAYRLRWVRPLVVT